MNVRSLITAAIVTALAALTAPAVMAASADDTVRYVYLTNGTVVEGKTEVINGTLRIITPDGRRLSYPMIEVREVRDAPLRRPDVKSDSNLADYSLSDTGFWIATQASGLYSCYFHRHNSFATEVNVTAGYRFSQFLRVGVGTGARYYTSSRSLRKYGESWACPIFANIRGNFIRDTYRDVVPYYSFDLGATLPDGVMFRPTVGVRVGRHRSAFLAGITYLGQSMKTTPKGRRQLTSMVGLTVGYEF